MRYPATSALTLVSLLVLAACSQEGSFEPDLDATALVYRVEANGDREIEDDEASGGEAVILFNQGARASFSLADVPAGEYRVSVVARSEYYKGWSVMRLYLDGQPVGEDNPVERSSYGEDAQKFGELSLGQGQRLEAAFVNDLFEGSQDKDRNLIVDQLILEPVGTPAPAQPEPPAPSDGTTDLFKSQDVPSDGTPAAPTSRARPPLLSDVSQQSWGASQGLAPQQMFWQQVPNYQEKKDAINRAAAGIEASGKMPCGGMQLWQDAFARSHPKGTYPGAPGRLNDGEYADLPGHQAWVEWVEKRPQYLGVGRDNQSLPGHYREWGGSWGYVSPAVPLDGGDYPEHYEGDRAYYADWLADRLGKLSGFTGAPCFGFSDFYDGHPHTPVKNYFNPRIIEDFQRRTGVNLKGSTLSDQAEEIQQDHALEWDDFWAERWAYGWAAIAREIERNTGKEAWLKTQSSFTVAGMRAHAVDARAILEQMSADNIFFLVQTVQHLHSGEVVRPESYSSAVLGTYAAREPDARYGQMLESSHEEFWGPVAATWPDLSASEREELGWKRLKRVWLESGWTHVATRQGDVRRAAEAFQRHYWDQGEIDDAWLERVQDIYPARPFGPALYYSVALERVYEERVAKDNRNYLKDAYLGSGVQAVTDLREAGVPFNYYVSDATLSSLGDGYKPSAWLVPERYLDEQDRLPAGELQELEKVAPVLSSEEAKAQSPLKLSTTQAGRTITGYGFFDQQGRLIVVASDQIKLDESGDPGAVKATVSLDLPDGSYRAEELFSEKAVDFEVRSGTGAFDITVDRWDTQVFAITPR